MTESRLATRLQAMAERPRSSTRSTRQHRHYYGPYYERLAQPGLRSDAALKEAVEAALSEDGALDVARLTVAVDQGVVTLRGCVATPAEKRAAGDDAWD